MTSNIPNYMAVKDLINCGVHEGRTGEARGRGEAQREDVAEKREKKTPEPKVRKKKKRKISK